MADYYRVTYIADPQGWKSPAAMETCWATGDIRQCRAEGADVLVCCRAPGGPGTGTKITDPATEIPAWLATLPRKPKDPTAIPPTWMTVAEEEAEVKRIAREFY